MARGRLSQAVHVADAPAGMRDYLQACVTTSSLQLWAGLTLDLNSLHLTNDHHQGGTPTVMHTPILLPLQFPVRCSPSLSPPFPVPGTRPVSWAEPTPCGGHAGDRGQLCRLQQAQGGAAGKWKAVL